MGCRDSNATDKETIMTIQDQLIDLGAATAETQGFPIPETDIVGVGLLAAGLSDED